MAYIIPSDITQLALAGGNTCELETLQILKTKLPPDYTVFHGVHWSREYAGHTVYGEIDFVIVNRSGEVLLIEQKNGPLDETANGLVKNYDDKSKNVGDQIKRSVDKIREKFKWIHREEGALHLDYLIYCPDYRVKKLNSAALDMSRVVDANVKVGLCKKIEKILTPGEF
ncbi:MAG: NERD domain-containing protein, partial [Proteobacteria bacterium]|nr:NERD domain-containing protein [Pseudomonadota bacterium]